MSLKDKKIYCQNNTNWKKHHQQQKKKKNETINILQSFIKYTGTALLKWF